MQKELRFRLSTEDLLNDVDVETKDYRERETVRARAFRRGLRKNGICEAFGLSVIAKEKR
jgi:hypothetical protein